MSAVAVALVLASALMHAVWNARARGGEDRLSELTVSYATGAVILVPWLIADPPTEALGLVLLSGMAHAGYLTFLSAAYRRGELATMYPLARGSAPLIVGFVGIWVLDQTPSVFVFAGAAVLASGLVVIGGVAWGDGQRHALVMALITGAFIAAYSMLDSLGVRETGAIGFFAASSVVAVTLMIVINRQSAARLRSSMRAGVSIGLLQSTGYVLVLLAFARAESARVVTLRGTSVLFVLALSRRNLNNRLVAGALMVVAGAALVVG